MSEQPQREGLLLGSKFLPCLHPSRLKYFTELTMSLHVSIFKMFSFTLNLIS